MTADSVEKRKTIAISAAYAFVFWHTCVSKKLHRM